MSSTYHLYGLNLSENQKANLAKAYQNKTGYTLRLTHKQLQGEDEIPLTATQIKKINNALLQKRGVEIKISRTQAMKGGSMFSAIANLATKALPAITKVGSKVLPTVGKVASHILPGIAQGISSTLASLGIEKLFGGTIYLEPDQIPFFLPYRDVFTPEQIDEMENAEQSGNGLQIDLSAEQQGGFLGALAASVGIPLLIKALTGSGLQFGRTSGKGMRVGRCGRGLQFTPQNGKGLHILTPEASQQHFEEIFRMNKKKGSGLLLGKNSPFSGIPLLGALL